MNTINEAFDAQNKALELAALVDGPLSLDGALEVVSSLARDREEVMNMLSRSDVVMMLNDAGAQVEDNRHFVKPSPDSFVKFEINGNKGYFIINEKRVYLWSGLGEYYDYAAEIKVKSAEHFADILRVLV